MDITDTTPFMRFFMERREALSWTSFDRITDEKREETEAAKDQVSNLTLVKQISKENLTSGSEVDRNTIFGALLADSNSSELKQKNLMVKEPLVLTSHEDRISFSHELR